MLAHIQDYPLLYSYIFFFDPKSEFPPFKIFSTRILAHNFKKKTKQCIILDGIKTFFFV